MKVNHIVFAFVLSIVFSSFSHAATYYVRTDGHDTNCNGSADASSASTPNCAFLTVQKGLDVGTSPGDVINIKGDHSAEGIITTKGHGCVSDCSESPTYITIQTTTGDDDYSGIISPGIRVYHNYIVVQNLGIVGSGGAGNVLSGVSIDADYCKVLNNHFYNPSTAWGSTAIAISSGADSNLISGNLIEGDTNSTRDTGHHSGGSGETLIDSTKSWTENQWNGRPVFNLSIGGSWGTYAGTSVGNNGTFLSTSSPVTWETLLIALPSSTLMA